ncbi:TPA_asm: P [Epipactis gammacytorhabdovirus 1]|nr:TPA_asm: P [Epipactis gammacytorhabdovirus 1]
MNPANSESILPAIAENVKMISEGRILSEYDGLSEILAEASNPVTPAAELASAITYSGLGQSSASKNNFIKQDAKKLKEMAIKTAGKLGINVDNGYLDHLSSVAQSENIVLSLRDVQMYFRGVARENQISTTTRLTELATNLEKLLLRSNQCIQTNTDASKLTAEKLIVLSTKIDSISPIILASLKEESSQVKSIIMSSKSAKDSAQSSSTLTASPMDIDPKGKGIIVTPPLRVLTPAEIKIMCRTLGMPEKESEVAANKFSGLVSWEEYKSVVSGNVSKEKFKVMLSSWNAKLKMKSVKD